MFVQLTHYFDKKKIAINTQMIEHICEYDTGTKIRCMKKDGTYLKDFHIEENISEVCDIINQVVEKNQGTVTVYYKESLFK